MSDIRPVDPHDDAAFDAWHEVYLASQLHGRGDWASPWQREELRAQVQAPSTLRSNTVYAGWSAGRLVSAGWLAMPLRDNLDRAYLAVDVAPGDRRSGHGAAMLAHLEQLALAEGRTVIGAETSWGLESGAEGEGDPGREFLVAHDYTLMLGDVQRQLDLPVADGLLDELAASAAGHHAAYTLRSWVGPVPDDLAESWLALSTTLMTEAPTGEMELEPEVVDVAEMRVHEEMVARQGRTKYNSVALDAEGTVVAYTDIATTVHEPDRAYQWGTLVAGAHRGHRLGLAVKAANLALLQRECPGVTRLTTYNAEVNAHMIGVNEMLGYRPVARLGEFEKKLA
ncbi:GNAT superfamily N-acetyltransferase [Nocardioides ginsengisegetis]|uniref:GNAT superfamily N-acetyltransferase n=1 Tax=Nocardioides ginsengisegetis TaxID=661491 RepID=A0A7W3IWU2_9ACTN|nr:PE-PGRS family protein [Nocardioides ginsengisegetis]MBA8802101.1 GNAT superfamily N-acetyltransferase [Nocardioides ginsengisegetis]